MPDSIDPLPSQPSLAPTKPDPEMPPRKSLAGGGGKLRKPITSKFRAAAEERLAQLRVKLRLHPLDPAPPSLSAAEDALRSLGLLDFARLGLQSEPPRPDLVAQLIAYYDPAQHRSFVWDTRLAVSRTDFARALSLPPKPSPTASPPDDVDPSALVTAVQEFMRVYVLPAFNGSEMCVLPPEVVAAEQAVKDESAHRVDWAGLLWGLVEKEILELPKRGDGVCYFGPYLQRLISTQKPDLFKLLIKEEEKGEAALVVSLDADTDQDDGDAGKSSDELEPVDSNADVRSNLVEASPLRSNNLDESESDDADADMNSKILSEEPEIKGASLRSNDLVVLESGNADADMNSKILLEEPEVKGASLRSNGLDVLESGDANADTRSKILLEEPEVKGASLRSSDLDVLESGDADGDTKINILEESKIEGACLRSDNLDQLESGDADADMNSKIILEESKMECAPLGSNNLEVLEPGDADADTKSKILDESKIEGACLRSNDLNDLDSGDADADMSCKKILEEPRIEGAPLRSNELESGYADSDMGSKEIMEESKIELLRSNNLDESESGDVDVDTRSKILEESETEGARLRSSNLDESESEDADLRSKNMDDVELGDVDANARSKIPEASMVAAEDAKGMDLDESKAGDELVIDFIAIAPEPLAVFHGARTSNDEVPGEMLCEGDEGVSVSAAQVDGSQSPEMVSVRQEDVLSLSEDDEEPECEEEEGTAGLSLGTSSANDDDSMDAEENASVENLDNEEGEESEQDEFDVYRGGVVMGWGMEDENGGDGTTNSFPGMQFENWNKENVGMRDVMSFDDGFSEKLGSLHGIESTNLLQAMNSIPAAYKDGDKPTGSDEDGDKLSGSDEDGDKKSGSDEDGDKQSGSDEDGDKQSGSDEDGGEQSGSGEDCDGDDNECKGDFMTRYQSRWLIWTAPAPLRQKKLEITNGQRSMVSTGHWGMYVKAVNESLVDQPDKQKEFVRFLRSFQSWRVRDVARTMEVLLDGQPELIRQFNRFLPNNCQIDVKGEEEEQPEVEEPV